MNFPSALSCSLHLDQTFLGSEETCGVRRFYSLLLPRAFSRLSRQPSAEAAAPSADASFSFSRASLRFSEHTPTGRGHGRSGKVKGRAGYIIIRLRGSGAVRGGKHHQRSGLPGT